MEEIAELRSEQRFVLGKALPELLAIPAITVPDPVTLRFLGGDPLGNPLREPGRVRGPERGEPGAEAVSRLDRPCGGWRSIVPLPCAPEVVRVPASDLA